MESSASAIPITEPQLSEFDNRVNQLMMSVKYAPKPEAQAPLEAGATSGWRESAFAKSEEETVSILRIAQRLHSETVLYPEDINYVLLSLRQGLRIGMHVSKLYTVTSGLDRLIAANRHGGLESAQKAEFRDKCQSAAAITAYCTAYYMSWRLASYKADEVGAIHMEFSGIPEVNLAGPAQALDCMLYYYAAYLEKSKTVHTDLDFVKLSLLYAKAMVGEIKMREGSLSHLEPFTEHIYKLKEETFFIHGFRAELGEAESSVEFNRVELGQIVGNHEAKHKARRLAFRLLCYDAKTKRNPFFDLGGLSLVRMGYGKPGTGKSLQIGATATLLHDHCKELGLPFLFWPMPDTVISTFQGGSAEKMVNWMRVIQDPGKIIYAPIDDGENNLEERTRQNVSAGVREVIGVFLRYTEGAYAIKRGNAAIEIFTNLPEQIDRAVLSRIIDRFEINGAEAIEDFLDQDHLWWRKLRDIHPDFVKMRDPEYPYMSAQTALRDLSAFYRGQTEPAEEQVREIYEKTKREHNPDEHMFFAKLYRGIQEAYPMFASRDIRNIQSGIDGRVMDFDLPEEWIEDHSLFFTKDYDTKRGMIVELIRQNMGGLSFAEIRLQETIRYLDNMARIGGAERERRIDEEVGRMDIYQEARARFETMQDGDGA